MIKVCLALNKTETDVQTRSQRCMRDALFNWYIWTISKINLYNAPIPGYAQVGSCGDFFNIINGLFRT